MFIRNYRNLPGLLALLLCFAILGSLVGCTSVDVGSSSTGSNQTLKVGSPAPSLSIAEWVQGSPVTSFESGKVYVVEFWATWCGPCKVSMPHIAKLQEKYGDKLHVIGVSDEDPDTVKSFMESEHPTMTNKTWADVANYTIAIDKSAGTNQDYMLAAGQNGIPCAFLVGKDGDIRWIGHPTKIDRPLAAAINE